MIGWDKVSAITTAQPSFLDAFKSKTIGHTRSPGRCLLQRVSCALPLPPLSRQHGSFFVSQKGQEMMAPTREWQALGAASTGKGEGALEARDPPVSFQVGSAAPLVDCHSRLPAAWPPISSRAQKCFDDGSRIPPACTSVAEARLTNTTCECPVWLGHLPGGCRPACLSAWASPLLVREWAVDGVVCH